MASENRFRPNIRVLQSFVRWIERPCFDPRFAKKWGLLYSASPEAAMCEATFWDILAGFGIDVEPNDLSDGQSAPDFLCHKNGLKFYVEVTCICLDTATGRTNLDAFGTATTGSRHYATLNRAIANECKDKTRQCANLDAPCLLGIGTFHFEASALVINQDCIGHLLTDEPQIAVAFDPIAGHGVGDPYQLTDFRRAPFTRLYGEQLEHMRQPISGLLIGGFGLMPPPLFGVLHPDARRPFDPTLLDRISFCRLNVNNLGDTVSAEWLRPIATE